MKKIFNYTILSMLTVFGLVSCSDDYEYQPGEWDAPEDYADVAFLNSGAAEELDPADPTQIAIHLTRRNTKGDVVVPVKILENTDNVFTLGECKFSDGDSLATFVANFPKAEVGKEYTLQLTVDDSKFVSSYSNSILYTYKVTRVKWNPAGYILENGSKIEGYATYTDDIISSYWSIAQLSYPVRLQEREDTPGFFRIVNAYSENWPYASYADKSKDYYLFVDATDPEYAFITGGLTDLGVNINDAGTHEVLSFVDYQAKKDGVDLSNPSELKAFKKKYPEYGGKYANGKITFPKQGLLQAVGGDGYYYANSHGAFGLVVDPSKDLYVATIENDFEWKEVYAGEFMSAQLGTSTGTVLEEGVCVTEKDSCGARFEKEFGKPYRIVAPYADGCDLIFCVKNGKVTVLEDYESQFIGTKAMGADVYAKINGSKSAFEEGKVKLNITFTNEEGTIEYGTTDEILENISWTPTYLGTYTYNFFFANEDGSPYYDEGLVLSQCDQNENKWKISSVFMGVDFVFNFDPKTNEVTFEEQSTGYEYPGYGMVYVAPLVKGNPYVDAEAPSYFEDGVFNFGLVYAIPAAGVYFTNCVGYETFTVTDAYDASAPVMLRNVKKNLSVKKNFQLSNKK